MNRVLVSHTDLDGIGCIVVAKFFEALTKQESFDHYMSENYGLEEKPEVLEQLLMSDEIFFTDLSCNKEFLDKLLAAGKKVSIYDHHDSSLWLLEEHHPNLTVFHDLTRSGAEIFFEEYYAKKYNRNKASIIQFVRLVGTYDLWKTTNELWETALSLNRILFKQYIWDKKGVDAAAPFINRQTSKLLAESTFEFNDSEKYIIQEEIEKEDRYFDKAVACMKIRKDSRGKLFAVSSLPGKISIVASRILNHPDYEALDYIIIANSYRGLSGKLSARSNKGFDCTELSCFHGHTAAAGTEVTVDQAKRLFEEPFAMNYKEDEKDETDIMIPCQEA